MENATMDRSFIKVNEIIKKHGARHQNLVAILQDVQAEYRYLPEEVMTYIATALDVPPAVVFGVSTFYSQFSMEPKGKYVVKVCDGTACHVRGSEPVHFAIRDAVGLKPGAVTTEDMQFTVETVACVGACGLAPVVMVNDEQVYGQMTADEAKKLIENLRTQGYTPKSAAADSAASAAGKPRRLANRRALDEYKKAAKARLLSQRARILICMETACVANGAEPVYEAFKQEIEKRGIGAEVRALRHEEHMSLHSVGLVKAGCHGYCQIGPLVKLVPANVMYCHVKPEDVPEIIEKTIENGEIIERLLFKEKGVIAKNESENPFYSGQKKVVLALSGLIDCEDIEEYIANDGYQAAAKALFQMSPDRVIDEITRSGLRGRGGGGFPAGKKWFLARQSKGDVKYVVCNGDEGDPGAFMDRSVMEGDPHRVLEGMLIAGHAIGAEEGFIYVRAEYPLAVKRLRMAIREAGELGILGQNILGSGKNFEISIREGAGAFVCGEETALLASMMGGRGMPMPKPPFPSDAGYDGKPTIINNVETFANVPAVIKNGAESFRSLGTEASPGTKTFALAGQVARTGLVEVPMGITLRDLVFGIGGGVRRPGHEFKAVQIGGPSGGCLTKEHMDLPLDFDSLKRVGAMVGSGGLVGMDDGTCMVENAKYFMTFIQNESCGKCVPCREGTKQMLAILTRITEGKGRLEDIATLEQLADTIGASALCGLGKTAPNPVLSTLKYFRDEYMAHVVDKRCPAGVCKSLVMYSIDENACKGCGVCRKACPAGAITGEIKKHHVIDKEACTKCGTCIEKCKFNAIVIS